MNSGNHFIINQWFDILDDLCNYEEFSDQLAMIDNVHILMYRAIVSTTDKSNEALISFLNTVSRNDRLISKIVTAQTASPLVA